MDEINIEITEDKPIIKIEQAIPIKGDAGEKGEKGDKGDAGTMDYNQLENKPDLSLKANINHNHNGIYELANNNIQNHISNISNPHNVTKSQIGLDNCDNTSDNNKPISTAVQTALNEKEPTITKNTAFNQNFETSVTNIKMDGVASVGSSNNIARADHIHPKDSSKVSTSTTVNGLALNSNITINTMNLGDYATGSWTPIDAGGANLTLDVRDARYTKIGNIVFFNLFMYYPTNNIQNAALVSGLPYPVGHWGCSFIETNLPVNNPTCEINVNTNKLSFISLNPPSQVLVNQFSEKYVLLSGFYFI